MSIFFIEVGLSGSFTVISRRPFSMHSAFSVTSQNLRRSHTSRIQNNKQEANRRKSNTERGTPCRLINICVKARCRAGYHPCLEICSKWQASTVVRDKYVCCGVAGPCREWSSLIGKLLDQTRSCLMQGLTIRVNATAIRTGTLAPRKCDVSVTKVCFVGRHLSLTGVRGSRACSCNMRSNRSVRGTQLEECL